jgi:hypothetical protein
MSDNGAWWLPILEKAFAKFMKTYLDMHGGFERVALRGMTGMPVRKHKTKYLRDDEIWDLISTADEKDYIMTASCDTSIDGLVKNHAYSLLGVNDKTDRLIMRNPWSKERYTGEGSDQVNDGTFEVPLEVF